MFWLSYECFSILCDAFLLKKIDFSWGKSSFKMLGLTFSSKLDWGSYIISIFSKTASQKIWALICSMKFLSPDTEVALYL